MKNYCEIFNNYYINNHQNNQETKSGIGSTYENTKIIRDRLLKVFALLNINSICDIPCGDCNFMKYIDFGKVKSYIGCDIVQEIIDNNRKNFVDYKNVQFNCLDIINNNLSKVDLIFCRDLFIHLSNNLIHKALQNIIDSRSKYFACEFFTTNINNKELNEDIEINQLFYNFGLEIK